MSSSLDFRADLNRSSVSRYIQLATLFRRRIESGHWPSGSQIPTIDDLAAEFGVARATIRQSLGILSGEGLVASFRAKGTFVTEKMPQPLWCEVTTDWNGLLMNRDGATIKVLSDYPSIAAPFVQEPVGIVQPQYRYLRRLHSRNDDPYMLADIYIDGKLASKLPPASFAEETAMRLAAKLPGIKITEARQRLTIGTADVETAELLQIPLNAPICHVNRFAVDQRGRLVLMALGCYRGDVVRMDIKLR
ncbi:GntR family transcriptional regulator [Novosphingobium sp. AAP83]|uniref:GntR family transcriptional regulator n=1 Tax=Novosphingobium sp. AAP83 TaxID=1523425 RepID=UPI000A99D524|nr:GntR family transcriptional regulator [Novosphingobium sp. AAP83]